MIFWIRQRTSNRHEYGEFDENYKAMHFSSLPYHDISEHFLNFLYFVYIKYYNDFYIIRDDTWGRTGSQ